MQASATRALIERRRHRRAPVNLPMIVTADIGGSRLSGSADSLDLSPIGARIRTTLELSPGQAVNVLVPERKRDEVSCRVVWVGAREGARHAGLEFLSPFD